MGEFPPHARRVMALILVMLTVGVLSACARVPRRAWSLEPQGTRPVVDVAGRVVGRLITTAWTTPIVMLEKDSHPAAALPLRRQNVDADGALYYESSDCTGTPFTDAISVIRTSGPSTLLSSTAIGPPGRTVYVASPWEVKRLMTARSFVSHETCYVTHFEAMVVPVRSLLDLNAAFTPPFTVGEGS